MAESTEKPKNQLKPWNDTDEMFLYTMREDGIPYRDISTELHRSVRACERKYQTTDWEAKGVYDPVKGRMKERLKRSFTEKVVQAQEKRQNLKNMIGDIIADRIAQAVKALPVVQKTIYQKKPYKSNKKHSDEDVGLIISDAHIGHHHSLEETGGISKYDVNVFKERMGNLKCALRDIVELHSKLYHLPVLHIFSLGDVVAGMNNVGAWSPTYINLPIYDQVMIGADAIADAIYYWLGLFDEIKFYGLVGNHGRCSQLGSEKEYVNWDLICYKFLEARFKDNPRVSFDIPLNWFIMKEIRKHKFLMVHGDSIRGSNPLSKLVSLEEKMTGILKEMPDYTLAAHFHCPAEQTTNHGRVIINGSFIGSDLYSLKDLKSGVKPEQKVFGIHDKQGITWSYNLNLTIPRF